MFHLSCLTKQYTNKHLYSKTGGGTVTEPARGFNSSDLATVIQKRNDRVSTSTPKPSSSSSSDSSSSKNSLSRGAIAGICVGSIAGAAIVAAFAALAIVRKKKQNQGFVPTAEKSPQEPSPPAELNGTPAAHEMGTQSNVAEKDGISQQPLAQLDSRHIAELDGTGSGR